MKVTIPIRIAEKKDFFAVDNTPLFGTVFFLKNSKGEIETHPYYFTKEIDKDSFKKWFANEQVYVFQKMFETIEIIN